MAIRTILVWCAVAALLHASEIDDNEQKKRGASKTTTLNAIPTGAQKQEYTYIYQNQPQSNPSPSYQNQISNSFYPTQGASQYYSSSQPTETPQYPGQPQINLIPPQTTSQFVPLNFIPNPGYQTKYQLIPSKSQTGNIQLAIIPQPQAYSQPFPYHHLFAPNPQQISAQQPLQGQYNIPQTYQFQNPYLSHPSMFFLAQPNPSPYNNYNNIIYPNPAQSLYNYYTPNQSTQTKYSNSPVLSPPSSEYEKIQGPVSQSITKEDNDLSSHSSEYITSSDSSSYKNYSPGRTSYSKL